MTEVQGPAYTRTVRCHRFIDETPARVHGQKPVGLLLASWASQQTDVSQSMNMARVTMARSLTARFSSRVAIRLEAVDQMLDLVAFPIGGLVGVGLTRLVLAGRDDRLEPMRPEATTRRRIGVISVPGRPAGPQARAASP